MRRERVFGRLHTVTRPGERAVNLNGCIACAAVYKLTACR